VPSWLQLWQWPRDAGPVWSAFSIELDQCPSQMEAHVVLSFQCVAGHRPQSPIGSIQVLYFLFLKIGHKAGGRR
jgi:hypothetical protein